MGKSKSMSLKVSSSAVMSIHSGCSAAIALGLRERGIPSGLVSSLGLGTRVGFGFKGASASLVIDFGLALQDFFGLVATSVFKMLYNIDNKLSNTKSLRIIGRISIQ